MTQGLDKNGHQHSQDRRIEALEIAVGNNRTILARAIGVGIGVSAMLSLLMLMFNLAISEKSAAFQEHETRLDQNERVIIGHIEKSEQELLGYRQALDAIKGRHEHDMARVNKDLEKIERRVERR